MEGRVEPLKEEAAIAKEYKTLSHQMKHSDIVVTVHDIDQYTNDNRQLDQRLNDLQGQQANKEADKQRLSNKFNNIKVSVINLIMMLNRLIIN